MKKDLIWLLVMLLFGTLFLAAFDSCKKESRQALTPAIPNDLIIHSSGNKTVMINDSIITENGSLGNYHGEAATGLIISSWTWTFTESNGLITQAYGQDVAYRFTALGYGSVKLVAIDQYSQLHQTVDPTRVVYDISQIDPVTNWSSTLISTGVWQENWAINKRTMKWPGTYGYIGTVTSPQWTLVNLSPADTNYLLVSGNLIPANTGTNGTQISVKPIVTPVSYPTHDQMGIVKTTILGVQIWANLLGSRFVNTANPTVILFSLLSDGTIIPNLSGSNNSPGDIGDNVVRFTMMTDSVYVYFNNNAPFGSNTPFYTWGLPNGIWNSPASQSPVANYANWGMLRIAYDQLTTGLLILNFGSNIAIPQYLNPNISTSDYWDGFYHELRIVIKTVSTMDKAGNIVPVKQLASTHMIIAK